MLLSSKDKGKKHHSTWIQDIALLLGNVTRQSVAGLEAVLYTLFGVYLDSGDVFFPNA